MRKWLAIWLLVNALFLVAPTVLLYRELGNIPSREYPGGYSDLTRNDIPYLAMVSTVYLFCALAILNAIAFGVWEVWKLIRNRQSRII